MGERHPHHRRADGDPGEIVHVSYHGRFGVSMGGVVGQGVSPRLVRRLA
jgi:hypothetical protein